MLPSSTARLVVVASSWAIGPGLQAADMLILCKKRQFPLDVFSLHSADCDFRCPLQERGFCARGDSIVALHRIGNASVIKVGTANPCLSFVPLLCLTQGHQ
jgi:hypothetical protein